MGNVTFLGVEGSGKTVLTMALVNAFKAHEAEGWYLRPETRGAFRFLSQVPENVSGNSLPHQTTSLRQLQWSVVYQDEVQRTLDILDYPGEVYRLAFLDAKDDPDPDGFRERVAANQEEISALLGHLIDSDQVFVLFNLADAEDVAGNGANLDAVWVTNACLDYLHRLPSHPQITLLLTQIDRYVDLGMGEFDPQAYVAHYLPLLAKNFPSLDVLAVSAIGEAHETFGLDGLFARCFVDAPCVQNPFEALQNALRAFSHAWKDFCETLSERDAHSLIHDWNAYLSARKASVALWFFSERGLVENGIIFSSDEQKDIRALLDCIRHGSQGLAERLYDCDPKTELGARWKNALLAGISRHLQATADSREKRFAAIAITILLGVLILIAWWFVIATA